MEIRKSILTKNECYIVGAPQKVKGVLWHSTGANNPKLSRYVPDDGNLGPNKYNNHWNTARPGGKKKCVHAFIGKDKLGKVQIYQTLPFEMRAWGAGSGPKGSANDGYIQFEICEDSLNDKSYFEEVYKAGVWFTAEMHKRYGFKLNEVTVIDHSGANKLGIASNHSDVMHWFKKYGKTMKDVISDVDKLLNPHPPPKPTFNVFKMGDKGDGVKVLQAGLMRLGYVFAGGVDGSFGYGTESAVKAFQKRTGLVIDGIAGPLTLAKLDSEIRELPNFKPYIVRVTVSALNVRETPTTKARITKVVYGGNAFTIVYEKDGWGKLKSGLGWIFLKYTEKV